MTMRASSSRFLKSFLLFLPLIVFMALAIVFFLKLRTYNTPEETPVVQLEKQAPPFQAPPLKGLETPQKTPVPGFSTKTLEGKVSVLNIWASWCLPCRQEHPILMDLAQDARIQMLGLNARDDPEKALAFLRKEGLPYDRVGVDPGGFIGIDFGVYAIPETFLIDRKGVIRYRFIGPLTRKAFQEQMLPLIEKLLAEE